MVTWHLAFDTIDHTILMRKLERYGIRGIAHTWLGNYLYNREQYVHIQNDKSDLMKVTCGVPQGSVLGPKLFLLYINEICNVSKLLKYVLFADDTNLFCSGGDLRQLLDTVEKELKILKRWFDINKLSLNLKKTKFIIFGYKKIKHEIKIMIDHVEIERVYENKFLGVIIDHKLCWKPHLKQVKRKVSMSTAILYKTKDVFNTKSLHMLYCSLILPYITYCVEIWGNTYKTVTNPIFILQKRAIRIINRAEYLEPTNTLFINSNALKFRDLVEFKTMQIMYKVKNRIVPDCIQKLFQIRQSKYELRGMCMFNKINIRTNVKQRCMSVQGVNMWNVLDEEIKTCDTVQRFKKILKNKMLNKYKSEA